MAIIQLGITSQDVRGRVGNLSFGKTLGGNSLRICPIPANPQSTRQRNIRGGVARFSRQWAMLTPTQRDAWNDYAKTRSHTNSVGNTTTPVGINAFIGVNQSLALIAAPPVTDPPPTNATVSTLANGNGALTITAGVITAFTLTLTLTHGGALATGEKIFVRMTKPLSGGQSLPVTLRHLSAINTGTPYLTLTPDVLPDYTARFPTAIATGQIIAVVLKIIQATTGVSSDYLRFLVRQ